MLLSLIQEDEALRLGNQPTFAAALELAKSTSSLGILLYPEEPYEGDREPTPEQVVNFGMTKRMRNMTFFLTGRFPQVRNNIDVDRPCNID